MRSTTALRMFRQTPRMLRPVPAIPSLSVSESSSRSPPELYPLAVVVGFALGAAGYSISRKFIVDKNLRLARQGPAGRHDAGHAEGHAEGESDGH
ncbi:hypothetical protein RAB80_006209 [Fusarium oxysporum f. sp. vasinfectum]|nr:hypothetical protein RAB80_006209 [Fusarium oxysporum f. sp. vasinfectum]